MKINALAGGFTFAGKHLLLEQFDLARIWLACVCFVRLRNDVLLPSPRLHMSSSIADDLHLSMVHDQIADENFGEVEKFTEREQDLKIR
jgi:hypothetical protein